jgi:hypothetical protein
MGGAGEDAFGLDSRQSSAAPAVIQPQPANKPFNKRLALKVC